MHKNQGNNNLTAMISLLATLMFGIVASGPALADDELTKPDVSILIARDPFVQAELDLSDRQIESVDEALAELDELVFALRDQDSPPVARQFLQALRKADRRLRGVTNARQYRRFKNVVLQAQGYKALFEMDSARRLKISDDQEKEIKKELRNTSREIAELRSADSDDGEPDGFILQAIKRVEREGEDRVHALLTEKQRKQWANLRGAPFDLSKVQEPAPRAPEFDGINGWINSEPLTMESLRGKVVLVHFWTFGDRVCAASYPAYKTWAKRYGEQGLVVIGIHTPEFPEEQDIDAVRAQAQLNELNFPIAIDNDAKTWNAWANPMWPAVYLIDRKGCARYRWYGALNQPDAAGGDYLRNRIEELLAH